MSLGLIALAIIPIQVSEAGFTQLFRKGDDAVVFEETCVFISEGQDSGVPGGKPCNMRSPEHMTFERGADEDQVISGSDVRSASGSIMHIGEVPQGQISISIDGKDALHFSASTVRTIEPVSAAFWHGKDWVVESEYLGKGVAVDGKQIGRKEGYESVFFYRYIGDKPFFFFIRNGVVGVSYNGVEQRSSYDAVASGLCCESGMYNIAYSKGAVGFYARRGETWLYVVARPRVDLSHTDTNRK